MAVKLKPGQVLKRYEIVREMSAGAFAIAYEAKRGKEKVFLKQYKSPSPLVPWYKGFVAHQNELRKRIEANLAASERCYRFVEFFENGASFYQVFEFIEGGMNLTDCLAQRDKFDWDKQIVVFAKIMTFGIKALQAIRIIHTDLKPDNVILIPDATIGLGYRLRLIDMDWSIFSDTQAPWHGIQGYIGTPDYQSPEHLRGETPTLASDVFTTGIMLGQLLGGRHPFADVGENYAEAAVSGNFSPVSIGKPIAKIADLAFLEGVINSCMNPKASERPTFEQLSEALSGKVFAWSPFVPKEGKPPASSPEVKPAAPAATPASSATLGSKVEIWFDDRRITTVGISSALGKSHFRNVAADAQFLSEPQFHLTHSADGWRINHDTHATNETIVNGVALKVPTAVTDGMCVRVGNSAKGIEKFPLILKVIA